ncbi:hypothetical protein BGZ92_001901 [Podila epicladia]|nr:hypothetical protein BGZ92_001901 [Podila epicladia]
MVKLTLPLLDNTDNENPNSSLPVCDPSMSIYDSKTCIKDSMFCSDDNPCPLGISCIDRVCQCLPNTHSYITLTPDPVRMYTIGCNFDKKREASSCREYEYGVDKTCLLNYCSSEVPCYAGSCDNNRHVCTNITSARTSLPTSANQVISLGDDPFGTKKEGLSPLIIIMAAAGGSPHFSPFTNHLDSPKLNPFRSRADTDASSNGSIELSGRGLGLGDDLGTPKRLSRGSYVNVPGGTPIISSEITIAGHAQPQSAIYEGFEGESASLHHVHRPDSSVLSSGPSSESLASEPHSSPSTLSHLDPSALLSVHRSPSQSTLRQATLAVPGHNPTP